MPEIKIMLGSILKDRNMTQTELVKLTGIRSETISNLSRGKIEKPSLEHLAKIMTALEITDVGEILNYVGSDTVESTAYPVTRDNEPAEVDPLDQPIEVLALPAKIYFALTRSWSRIKTVRDLTESDLTRIRNIGPASIEIINETLDKYTKENL